MSNTIIKNKKAFFEYEVLESFEAGIALKGTEVKNLRLGKVKMVDAFCQVNKSGELILHQMEIQQYSHGNIHNHHPKRDRKLLMHRREIVRLEQRAKEKGLSIIPISLYFKGGKVKVSIALAKGKKLHDKRASLKEKDAKREIDREMKGG